MTLGWQPSASPNIAGYVVFYGTVSGAYTSSNNVGVVTNATVTNLQSGTTYYFAVSDFDTSGAQSTLSASISYTVPGGGAANVTWSNPANVVYGTSLGASQLNASANVPGSFAYSPAAGTVLPAGNAQILSVVFSPQDTTNYLSLTNTTTINVLKAPLTITANNQSKTYGATLPGLTAAYAGFVNGDTSASLTTAASLTTTGTASSPAGAYSITASGAANPNYTISYVAGTLTVAKAALTVTANNQSKAYGAALPTLTAGYGGFVNGDTSASLTTAPSLATTGTASSPAGTYSITANAAADSNYTISYVAGTLTVSKVALTITANNQSKAYGAALPTLTAAYGGFVNGETSASLTTAPSLATTGTASSPAGTYSITAGGAADPNYTISYVSGTLTVSKAALTITANNQSKPYGAALPTLTAAYAGFINGDTSASLTISPSLSTTATAGSPVGTYPITLSGASDPNYTISYVNGVLTITGNAPVVTWTNPAAIVYGVALSSNQLNATASVPGSFACSPTNGTVLNTGTNALSVIFTPTDTVDYSTAIATVNLAVAPATLTVTATNASRAYGQSNPVLGGAIVGLQNGDNITATYSSGATGGTPAGTYAIVPSLVDPGNRRTNYSVSLTDGTLTVSKAALTVTANNQTKAYSAALPTLTAAYAGFVNGDTSASFTTAPSLATTGTASSPAGTYSITASGAADPNYTISYVAGTLTVSKAALTVSAINQSKTYGGALPTLSVAYAGFVNGDTSATLTTAPSLTTTGKASSPAGAYSITASGAADPNYTISYVAGTLTVSKAPLTITANNQSKAYGTALPTLTAVYSGFVNGDTSASLTISPSLSTTATAGSPVGTYPINPSGASDPNYTIFYVNGVLTITGNAPVVTWTNPASIVYGTALSSNELNATASVPGIFAYSPTNGTVLNTGANTLSITFTPTDTVDYSAGAATVNLVVDPAVLIMTASNASRAYGQTNLAFGGTITGLQNGDSITATYTCSASSNSRVGTYAIVPSLVDPENRQTNYNVSVIDGTLTVKRTSPHMTWGNPPAIIYGTALSSNQLNATATIIDVSTNDPTGQPLPQIVGDGSFAYSPTNGAVINTGTNILSVTFTPTDSVDYTNASATVSLVVSPAVLTVTASNVSRAYGQIDPAFGGTITGLQNGDNITATFSCSASNDSPAATYAIAPSLVDPEDLQTNYIVSLTNGTLTVTQPIPLVISTSASAINIQFPVAPSTAYDLQASFDLKTWNDVLNFTNGSTNDLYQYTEPLTNSVPARFYRLVTP